MKIELKLTYDSYNTNVSDSLFIETSHQGGCVTLRLSDSDREFSVSCLQLRKALRALQTWENDE